MIVYSKSNDQNKGVIGRIDTPIKMVIEYESDLIKKKGGICDWLYNVEKSNRFAETIINMNEFSSFQYAAEGAGAEYDTVSEVGRKFIEHFQFMKEFVVTAEMMEDANFGIAAEAKRRAVNFTRAYYKTINTICEMALANATSAYSTVLGARLNHVTADGSPLFSGEHEYGEDLKTQSNFYYGNLFHAQGSSEYSAAAFEESLTRLSLNLRNMRDDKGDPMGYVADTIILPGNRPAAEMLVKKLCGSMGTIGSPNNDINLHYGNWNIIILPHWVTADDRLMIMSSEANKALGGNMFFNRVPLTIDNWIDHHTGNHVFTGRCRFGVGFGTYKHILLAVDSATQVLNSTPL